jgi:hypothetical protein
VKKLLSLLCALGLFVGSIAIVGCGDAKTSKKADSGSSTTPAKEKTDGK